MCDGGHSPSMGLRMLLFGPLLPHGGDEEIAFILLWCLSGWLGENAVRLMFPETRKMARKASCSHNAIWGLIVQVLYRGRVGYPVWKCKNRSMRWQNWGEREDVILVWRRRKKWALLGLGKGNMKLTTYVGDERNNRLLITEVNKAVAGPKNRSGNHSC